MRVTILSPPFNLSGGHRVKAIYAERLSRRGHDVVVVAPPAPRPGVRRKLVSLGRGRGWPRTPRHVPTHFDGLDVECRVLDRYRPVRAADLPDADVVVATWWETAEWAAALPPSKGAKAYLIQGYELFPYLPLDRLKATWRLPFQKIAVSQWLVDIAREEYGDRDVILVPNGVDTSQFWAPPRDKNKTPTVGLVYSAAPFKGCDLSLEAVRIATRQVPDLRLLGFGESPPTPLPDSADFVVRPPQNQLREIYSRCDAWLFGSRAEGFGLPILEAMACRTPVIATPAGAAPELLATGGGRLVHSDDPSDMARKIVETVRLEPAAWAEMSAAALATARQHTWDDATDRFEAALLATVDRQNRSHLR